MNATWKTKLNHWGVGLAVLGVVLHASPSIDVLGAGVSAVGLAYFAASLGRTPTWALLAFIPFIGPIGALIVLTALKPRPQDSREGDSRLVRFLCRPVVWAIPLFIIAASFWWQTNPAFTAYRIQAYNQMARVTLDRAIEAQKRYMKENGTYANSMDVLKKASRGPSVPKGVTIRFLKANKGEFVMDAFHLKGDKRYEIKGPEGSVTTHSK